MDHTHIYIHKYIHTHTYVCCVCVYFTEPFQLSCRAHPSIPKMLQLGYPKNKGHAPT